jgi:hypothetical protein
MCALRVTLAIMVVTCGAAACARKSAPPEAPPSTSPPPATQLANPASTHCVQEGGRLVIERRPDGAEYGLCLFEDNRQCEEWALLRGECRAGGVRITGYATSAGRYCAITGGSYAAVMNEAGQSEQDTCTLPGGKVCDAGEYYRGSCGR